MPATVNGIRRYLASGQIRGVGEVMAGRMVDMFGASVLDVLENDPKRLLAVDGLGKKKLKDILASWEEHREVRALMLFLQTFEISTGYAGKIFKLYGNEAVARIKANPYDLIYEIRGIGFRTADRMALKLGLDPGSRERVEAAAVFALFSLREQGHLFFPADDLFDRVSGCSTARPNRPCSSRPAARREDTGQPLPFRSRTPQGRVPQPPHGYEKEVADRLWGLCNHPAATGSPSRQALAAGRSRPRPGSCCPRNSAAVRTALAGEGLRAHRRTGNGKTTITAWVCAPLTSSAEVKLQRHGPGGQAHDRGHGFRPPPCTSLQYSPTAPCAVSEETSSRPTPWGGRGPPMLDVRLCAQCSGQPLTGPAGPGRGRQPAALVGPGQCPGRHRGQQTVPPSG